MELLSQRVEHSLRSTGAAFDLGRAALAVECLTSGLSAVIRGADAK